MRCEHHSGCFFTAPGRHNNPVPNGKIVPVGSEVVQAPGIPKADADYTLGRRDIVKPEDGVTVSTAALADLLARFEAALEAFAREKARLLDRRRRRPGSL